MYYVPSTFSGGYKKYLKDIAVNKTQPSLPLYSHGPHVLVNGMVFVQQPKARGICYCSHHDWTAIPGSPFPSGHTVGLLFPDSLNLGMDIYDVFWQLDMSRSDMWYSGVEAQSQCTPCRTLFPFATSCVPGGGYHGWGKLQLVLSGQVLRWENNIYCFNPVRVCCCCCFCYYSKT